MSWKLLRLTRASQRGMLLNPFRFGATGGPAPPPPPPPPPPAQFLLDTFQGGASPLLDHTGETGATYSVLNPAYNNRPHLYAVEAGGYVRAIDYAGWSQQFQVTGLPDGTADFYVEIEFSFTSWGLSPYPEFPGTTPRYQISMLIGLDEWDGGNGIEATIYQMADDPWWQVVWNNPGFASGSDVLPTFTADATNVLRCEVTSARSHFKVFLNGGSLLETSVSPAFDAPPWIGMVLLDDNADTDSPDHFSWKVTRFEGGYL